MRPAQALSRKELLDKSYGRDKSIIHKLVDCALLCLIKIANPILFLNARESVERVVVTK